MNLLTIIIPQHKETDEDIFPLLHSLETQIGFQWNTGLISIKIVCDKEGIPLKNKYKKLLPNITPNIEFINDIENNGPGYSRQVGIDKSDSLYVMFCDSDDFLMASNVLTTFIQTLIEEPGINVLYSNILEELPNNQYCPIEKSPIWMHGKVYEKKFLEDNDIRFLDDLFTQEDVYFNGVCFALAKKTVHLNMLSYLWRCNKNSITRKNNQVFLFSGMIDFLDATEGIIESIKWNDELKPYIEFKILNCITFFYINMQKIDWEEHPDIKKNTEKIFAEFFSKYKNIWKKGTAKNKNALLIKHREKDKDLIVKEEGLNNFLKRILKENS